jgi:hypothetical protein
MKLSQIVILCALVSSGCAVKEMCFSSPDVLAADGEGCLQGTDPDINKFCGPGLVCVGMGLF